MQVTVERRLKSVFEQYIENYEKGGFKYLSWVGFMYEVVSSASNGKLDILQELLRVEVEADGKLWEEGRFVDSPKKEFGFAGRRIPLDDLSLSFLEDCYKGLYAVGVKNMGTCTFKSFIADLTSDIRFEYLLADANLTREEFLNALDNQETLVQPSVTYTAIEDVFQEVAMVGGHRVSIATSGEYVPIEESDNVLRYMFGKTKNNVIVVGKSPEQLEHMLLNIDSIKSVYQAPISQLIIYRFNALSIVDFDVNGKVVVNRNSLNNIITIANQNPFVVLAIDNISLLLNSQRSLIGSPLGKESPNVRIIGLELEGSSNIANILSKAVVKRMFNSVYLKKMDKVDEVDFLRINYNNTHKDVGVKVDDGIFEKVVSEVERYSGNVLADAMTLLDNVVMTAKHQGFSEVNDTLLTDTVRRMYAVKSLSLGSDVFLSLQETLSNQIYQQADVIEEICSTLKISQAGIHDKTKPLGSFLFLGSTGVGKTFLAQKLAENLFGDEENLVRLDMSEFIMEHDAHKILGTAPGYQGYGDVPPLVAALMENPNRVILLDEIEKADTSVLDLFLQVLDNGKLVVGTGQTVDFTKCIIVMTSNFGAQDILMNEGVGFGDHGVADKKSEVIDSLFSPNSAFRPEFLNRFDNIVVFNPLTDETLIDILKVELSKLETMRDIKFNLDDDVYRFLVDEVKKSELGAREIKRVFRKNITLPVADTLLRNKTINTIDINTTDSGIEVIVNE